MSCRVSVTLALVGAVVGGVPARATETVEQVDHLGLAALLLKDGHPDRAAALLEEVDPEAEELDAARFYTLRGLARLQIEQLAESVADLQAALATGEAVAMVHVYLAQAHYRLKAYHAAITAVTRAHQAGADFEALDELEGEAYWQLGDREQAWGVLSSAYERRPAAHRLLRRKVFYAIELGLFATAVDLGQVYLQRTGGQAEDSVAIGRALHESGHSEQAAIFLQAALLRYPGHRELSIELARIYVEDGRLLAGAMILEPLGAFDPELAKEAADLFRRSKHLHRALQANTLVIDPQAKLRQRFAILLDMRRFEMIVAMERDLRRTRLLDEDPIRYALAYALFSIGQYERAEKHLAPLTDATLFARATELRRIMQECAGEPWMCASPAPVL
jgi:tetratricopeptide (TPR) repeat protein